MSPLRERIKLYEANQARSKIDTHLQPLFEFVLLLCKNANFKGADEILSHLIESPSFPKYETFASLWILRSEIAEEMGELQKSVKLFEQAAKYQAQPSMDVINAFTSFQQRHSNHPRQTHKKTTPHTDTPRPPISNPLCGKKKVEAKLTNKNKHSSSKPPEPSPANAMPSIAVSPIIHNQIPCTPLTDDFEHSIFESERKSKQRQKKFEFRSRQSMKQQIASSYYDTTGTAHGNSKRSMSAASDAPSPSIPPLPTARHKTPLSPILDVTESELSMSSSIPPVTPKTNTSEPGHDDKDSDNDHSMMDMSGISDISSIDHMDTSVTFKSPQLPPKLAPSTPPQRRSALSELNAKPAKRNKDDMAQIMQRLDSIDIEQKPHVQQQRNEGKVKGKEKSEMYTIEKLLKQTQQEQNKENEQRYKKYLQGVEGGTCVTMQLITLSPSKANKYGSKKILSPVRRSKRNQHKASAEEQNVQKLLQQSNYTYVPNPSLNVQHKKK
eukprot:CAMPEP_0197034344 /NCGR_PEP_ID=MMETSP1384-20130603/12489_1 /TAXON_ID=29189 /ORGANISM="Ammonia sp." /LENGTH=495 /DNA_ID=CAMNT_0042464263 /DNA_START=34 /DNA_END=1521 /DNA_ORIENTATION=+